MPSAGLRMSGHCSFDIHYFVSAAKRPYCFCDSILGRSGLHKMRFGISWSGLEDGKKLSQATRPSIPMIYPWHPLHVASVSQLSFAIHFTKSLCLRAVHLNQRRSMPNVGLGFAECMATCAKSIQNARFNMNHDEPTFLVVTTQQGLNQLGTTTPIEKAISKLPSHSQESKCILPGPKCCCSRPVCGMPSTYGPSNFLWYSLIMHL